MSAGLPGAADVIAWLVFADLAQKRRKDRAAGRRARETVETGIEWHKTLQAKSTSAGQTFRGPGIRCSWLPVRWASSPDGWPASGIGGGLIRMPALIYLIGCPTHVAVGTDLFEVAMSGLYGAATYSTRAAWSCWPR